LAEPAPVTTSVPETPCRIEGRCYFGDHRRKVASVVHARRSTEYGLSPDYTAPLPLTQEGAIARGGTVAEDGSVIVDLHDDDEFPPARCLFDSKGRITKVHQPPPSSEEFYMGYDYWYFYDCPRAPPIPAAAKAAVDAYRGILNSYVARDAEAYFAGFTDPMECFYGKTGVTAAALRRQREGAFDYGDTIHSHELQVLSASPSEVALEDWGDSGLGGAEWHDKIIVLRAKGGRWKIAVEGGARRNPCPGVSAVPAPAGIARCREIDQTCYRDCDQERGLDRFCGNRCSICSERCMESHDACVDNLNVPVRTP
jgi:hypothetical protein